MEIRVRVRTRQDNKTREKTTTRTQTRQGKPHRKNGEGFALLSLKGKG